ncbi:kinase-like domain-containing protein [Scleroderma citrinum]
MHLWSKLRHENIVPLLGITTKFDDTVSIVSEWMVNGNAHDYVQSRANDPRPLLLGIAHGLHYLHSQPNPVLHGDLKGYNVLISADGRALLSDFGLSHSATSSFSMSISKPLGGSVPWMSPEHIDEFEISVATDIWSFGMTALELFTGQAPYHTCRTLTNIVIQILRGPPDRPNYESTCSRLTDDWWKLCLLCWHRDPALRPSTADVIKRIQVSPLCAWIQLFTLNLDNCHTYFSFTAS